MAFVYADRVLDTTTTAGTGTITLAGGAPRSYQNFSSVCSNNDTTIIAIISRDFNEWEIQTSSTFNTPNPGTLTRTAGNVLAGSSGAGTLVNFSAGTKDVAIVRAAQALQPLSNTQIVYTESGQVTGNADFTLTPGASPGNGESSLRVNGGILIVQPSDYGQGVNFDMHTTGYVQILCLDNSGTTGLTIAVPDGSGNYGNGYWKANSTGMQFLSPVFAATSTKTPMEFDIQETNGSFTTAFKVLITYQTAFQKPIADQSYSYQQPTTGFSITVADGVGTLLLDPAGTLATGTITMPPTPVDGQLLWIKSSQTITALTLSPNSGQSILGAPTTLALGGLIQCMYRSANTTWYG